MALITSAASGNFNAGATWTGGVVPGVGDEARASTGHTITITANATCAEISNAGTGTFVLNSGVTLTANVTNKSSTSSVNCLSFSSASPATATIVGNCTGGTVLNAVAVVNSSTGTLVVTASGGVIGGSGNSSFGINNTSTGAVNVSGNVNGGNGILAYGINNNSTGIITVTGNSTGGTGGANSPHGINNATSGTINLTGSVTGGSSTGVASYGINNASTGTITVTGGEITATNQAAAIVSRTGTNRISGSMISSSNGTLPVDAVKMIALTTPTAAKTRYALNGSGTYVDMFTADNTGLAPAVEDVRAGVVYGSATGVLAVPAANSVAFGVPVDNTTGTAVLTAEAVWSAATRTLTAGAGISASDVWAYATRTLTSASGPSAVEIRQEMDSNSTKLANLDASVSSRLAGSAATELAAVKAKTDALNTERLANVPTVNILGTLLAQANS